jgi:hypothetical protein
MPASLLPPPFPSPPPPFLPSSPLASLPDLGRGGSPNPHLGEARCLLSPLPSLLSSSHPPPCPFCAPSPHRLAPGPWAWRLLRSPHLRRSPMPLSPLPPFLSSLLTPLPLLCPAPIASLPDLGRGGYRMPAPPRSPSSSLLSLPFSLPSSPFPFCAPSPHRSAPGPWAWRLLRMPTPRRKSRCLLLLLPTFFLPSRPSPLCPQPPSPRSPDLGRGGSSKPTPPGEAPCLLSPSPFFLLGLPHRLGSPDLGRGGCARRWHLREAPCSSSPPRFLPSPPPPLVTPTLGVEHSDPEASGGHPPGRSSRPFLPPRPPPPLGSPTLGVEATPNPHWANHVLPILLSPPSPSPHRPRFPGPWAWRLLQSPHPAANPDASSLLLPPLLPPFSPLPLTAPSPHRLAPRPWAWRTCRSPHLREAPCLFLLLALPFSSLSPHSPFCPQPPSPRSRTLGVWRLLPRAHTLGEAPCLSLSYSLPFLPRLPHRPAPRPWAWRPLRSPHR